MTTHATLRDDIHAAQPRAGSRRTRAAELLLPEEHRARRRLYVVVGVLLYLAAWGLLLVRAQVKQTTADFIVSDAIGYYAYLPSLVIDRDLQFENQLLAQYRGNVPEDIRNAEAKHGWPFPKGKLRWPMGVALSVAPGFLVAHALSHPLHAVTGAEWLRPDGYSLLYQLICVANALAVGVAGMIAADRLLVERFHIGGRAAAAGVLTFWLGTHYLWFVVREPLIAHMIGASWIIFCIYLLHRIELESRDGGAPAGWYLPLLAFAAALALMCRATNAFIVPLFVYLLVILVRRRLLGQVLRQSPLIVVGVAPLVAQLALMRYYNGPIDGSAAPQQLGYGRVERFYWTDPALVLSLFSSRRGLFFWTPALLFSAWGLIWHLCRRRGWRDPLLACLVVSAMILWYVNASWYAWWFGDSAGNRGYIELAGLFIIGFGLAYTWLQQASTRVRPVVLALVLVGVMVNHTLMGLKMLEVVRGHSPLLKWEQRAFTGRWERF